MEDAKDVLDYVHSIPAGAKRAPSTAQSSTALGIPQLASRAPRASLSLSLNHDILAMIFTHIAQSSLESPTFQNDKRITGSRFLSVCRPEGPNHSLTTLRACTFVSKAWYEAASKLLWYTATIQLEHLDEELSKWRGLGIEHGRETSNGELIDDVPLHGADSQTSFKPQKKWVRRLVLMGGGMRSTFSSKNQNLLLWNLWHAFPCIQHIEIFGLGWGTEGLLNGPPRSMIPPSFKRIHSLEITATSEYLLRSKVPGQNFLETVDFLGYLPALRRLVLRGFTYRVPASSSVSQVVGASPLSTTTTNSQITSSQEDSPNHPKRVPPLYALDALVLDKCSLALVALQWTLGPHSYATLSVMEVDGCSFWEDEDVEGLWGIGHDEPDSQGEGAFEGMIGRLSVDLPVISMSRSG